MSAWAFFYFTYATSGCGHIVVKTEKITEMENKLIRADLQEIGTGRTFWERTGIFQKVNYNKECTFKWMFTFHSVLCLQAITSNIQQHLQKKQTFKEGKYQLVLQRVTDSYRQSQSSCDKVLIICWAGKEIPASFPELCIFLFNRPGTREIFFFPSLLKWQAWRTALSWVTAFLTQREWTLAWFWPVLCSHLPCWRKIILHLFQQEYPVWFLHQELLSNKMS